MMTAYIEWMFHFVGAMFATGLALFCFCFLAAMLHICGLEVKRWREDKR